MEAENIEKIAKFIEEFMISMNKSAAEGFAFFKAQWVNFAFDERRILRELIIGFCSEKLTTSDISLREGIYLMATIIYTEKEVVDGTIIEDDLLPKLVLSDDINKNQIVKIFSDLKKHGYIKSSYELIADSISSIFPISYSTAYKDLTEKDRLLKVQSPL